MARVATLQREQLHQALETVYRDGMYRGGTYAYAMGHRDALDDVAEDFGRSMALCTPQRIKLDLLQIYASELLLANSTVSPFRSR